jgi:myo-inositol 2-dehydrogenase / D-chiro-inositol 1-dehydrogenase
MRLGLLGLGRIGAFHAETLAGLPAVEELVLSDPVPALAEQVAGRLGGAGRLGVAGRPGARIARSPEAVLAAGVDGMVIAAPTAFHAELIELCVAAGLPTFCEKPVARDSDEAARLARQIAGAGAVVQIGYPRRFDPAFAAARAAVAGGDLGVVHTVRSTTLDPAPPSRGYLAASGGIFRDCAVHDFDAVRWVTGQEVTEVYAAGTNQDAEWFGELGDVHTASAVLTLDGGALAVVSNSRYNARGHDVRLEVHGTRDSLAAGLGPGLPLRSAEPGVSFPDGKPFTFFMDRLAEAFRAELTAFTEMVAGRRASPCTIADAIETGWVAEACTLSLREHRPVRIEEVREHPGMT